MRSKKLLLERLEDRVVLHGPEDLVPLTAVTHTAVVSGVWSDPAIWGGSVPGADANVHVPASLAVTVDTFQEARLRTVRVDGLLQFASAGRLFADTVIVMPAGTFRMEGGGRVTFADRGPIDTVWDPHQFSRGLVSMGTFVVSGRTPTAFAAFASPPSTGATVLTLAKPVTDWRVGDELLVPGVRWDVNQDETVSIAEVLSPTQFAISAPLAYAHGSSPAGLPTYVAHMTRSVTFESESVAVPRRGHVMLMSDDSVVVGAHFKDLGRTDKSRPVNLTDNVRGRYPLHFHRLGELLTDPAVYAHHNVVRNAPGWGLTNHSSHVVAENNITFNAFGAGFVTEAGNEVGAFRRNIAVRTPGTDDDQHSRDVQQDYGFRGTGFWLQGGGISLDDNVAIGSHDVGFTVWSVGLYEADINYYVQYRTANLPDPSWGGGQDHINVQHVPLRSFTGNTAYGNPQGVGLFYHLLAVQHPGRSVVEGTVIWGCKAVGIDFIYGEQITFNKNTVLGDPTQNPYGGVGINHNFQIRAIEYTDNWIDYWAVPILS